MFARRSITVALAAAAAAVALGVGTASATMTPNVIGMSVSDAQNALAAAQFTNIVVTYPNGVRTANASDCPVTDQTPSATAGADTSDTITLTADC
ncbi:PASTA domain-containing protein [Antrihabitans cavernicola]|nr:PASTA domain-containing protein [Spelaeibacter cavernicola]